VTSDDDKVRKRSRCRKISGCLLQDCAARTTGLREIRYRRSQRTPVPGVTQLSYEGILLMRSARCNQCLSAGLRKGGSPCDRDQKYPGVPRFQSIFAAACCQVPAAGRRL